MTDIKLVKAERELLRFAFIEKLVQSRGNSLVIDSRKTKGNAKLRAHVEHLRELGLVKGVRLTESGEAIGKREHEEVTERRRAAAAKARAEQEK